MNQRIEVFEAEGYNQAELESENERLREERRTKKRNDPISSESEEGEFEIGVNHGEEESDGSPSEEGEEVNQDIDEDNQDEPMEEAEPQEVEDELPMFQEHYNALFSMDFVETKYPHDDTMKALGIFKDVELVLKNMHLAKFFSHRMESYKELTCELLASMRNHWDIKENELQSVWATIAEGEFSSLRSKAAQIRSPVLRYVHKALPTPSLQGKQQGQSMKEKSSYLTWGLSPSSHAPGMERSSEEIEHTQETSFPSDGYI
ncbi:unnamed protein product [Microthlaspi erraticum]|uniref:Arabidopsis retrotransposon Orf1 C-terminal domain-containing protein n=1 Tax=Microthlaspi erraticum TaxID=1685480 RepID=A0A6D2JUL2_9BRAS|nr:unnamed protein product [Microthlaspi erraticum]